MLKSVLSIKIFQARPFSTEYCVNKTSLCYFSVAWIIYKIKVLVTFEMRSTDFADLSLFWSQQEKVKQPNKDR